MDIKLKYDYASMPKSQASPKEMKMISGDLENIRARIEKEDVIYQRKQGKNLRIRLLYPDFFQEKKKYPLVFHVQGSAWFEQNLNGHILDFKEIVTSGYILAIVEYLPIPEAKFPGQVEDAKTAIRYLMEHSEELFIDVKNIFLSGDSSGGHTALMCWATWGQSLLDTSDDKLPEIRGCIDLYGVVDLVSLSEAESAVDHNVPNSPEALLLGGKIPSEYPKIAEKASVLNYLNEEIPTVPLLIMHGNKDTVIPFEQSVQLFEHCRMLDKEVEFYCVDDADHGGNVFYCQVVLQTIVDFLKKYTN